jgi:hypothetical protein
LWICIGFNANPDPAFYLKSDPVPGNKTSAYQDPDPGQTLSSLKGVFLHELYTGTFFTADYRQCFGTGTAGTSSSAAPQIPLCRRMLESNPGLLQLWNWQSEL